MGPNEWDGVRRRTAEVSTRTKREVWPASVVHKVSWQMVLTGQRVLKTMGRAQELTSLSALLMAFLGILQDVEDVLHQYVMCNVCFLVYLKEIHCVD